ncbi:MAG: DUF2934 domain-containing protein [Gammaproteobacteria bacterium]
MATRRTPDSSQPSVAKPATPAKSAVSAKTVATKPLTSTSAATKPAAPRKRASKPAAKPIATRSEVSPDARRAMIAESAYLRAERRGFAPGHEADDWCAAEREVDTLLSADANAAAQ